jgi:hypothetical protein
VARVNPLREEVTWKRSFFAEGTRVARRFIIRPKNTNFGLFL